MAPKRKRSTTAAAAAISSTTLNPEPVSSSLAKSTDFSRAVRAASKPQRRQSSQRSRRSANLAVTNPNSNPDVLDGINAVRASPDAEVGDKDAGTFNPVLEPSTENASTRGNNEHAYPTVNADAPTPAGGFEHGSLEGLDSKTANAGGMVMDPGITNGVKGPDTVEKAAPLSADVLSSVGHGSGQKKRGRASKHVKGDTNSTVIKPEVDRQTQEDVGVTVDPEVDEGLAENEEEVEEAISRPPPVNSDYLPLPWKGRLGYACLNTYLRNCNPPVFSSRTCRIASILEHRHPLKDPSQPEHPTKNRPDKDKPADVARGQRYVEELGLANARDVSKILRWNDKYGIKFLRLSSEMFPFASHDEYGYKLAPFAAATLAEVGKVVAKLGHRVTTHPGQFTQLGSPRKQVIDASFRDLEYHDEMLSLLKLPPQQDRDAVMILHLGGAFGDKEATKDRFRENYSKLSQSVKERLVLENDDVVWTVHDILPLCQELNIPMVLDFHHHNILFDADKIREGTKDITDLFPAILKTWTKKNKTPKMHYSEQCPEAITPRQRRKHSPRVMVLPPCPDTMDLMIEAKDKEQAVFELMRTFKLPGWNLFNDVIPHVRQDENKPIKPKPKKAAKKGKKKGKHAEDELDALDENIEEDGEEKPVVVPEDEVGMGGPERRVYWPQGMEDWLRPPKRVVKKKEDGAAAAAPAKKKRKMAAGSQAAVNGAVEEEDVKTPAKKLAPKKAASFKKKIQKVVPTPESSDDEKNSNVLSDLGDEDEDIDLEPVKKRAGRPAAPGRRKSGRGMEKVNYKEEEGDVSV